MHLFISTLLLAGQFKRSRKNINNLWGKNGIPFELYYSTAMIHVNVIISCIAFEVMTRMFNTINKINKPSNTTLVYGSVEEKPLTFPHHVSAINWSSSKATKLVGHSISSLSLV
jgi:hypothetical protein